MATVLPLRYKPPQLTRLPAASVDVHHAVEESPEEDVGEEPPDEPPREQRPSRLEVLVPPAAGF